MDFDGWTYDDFLRRLEAIRSYGSLDELAERIPGLEAILREMDVDLRGQLEPIERILRAMTPEERATPKLLEGEEGPARREAIAERAGVTVGAVESLVWQFKRLRDMLAERSLDEVTRELVEEATPERETWQQNAEGWKDREVEEILGLSSLEADEGDDEDDGDERDAAAEAAHLTGDRLDELLRKISSTGLASLSASERDELERASALLRTRG